MVLYDVNTPTLKDYIKVVQYCLDSGMRWIEGQTELMEHYWNGRDTYIQIRSSNTITCHCRGSNQNVCYLNINEFYIEFGIRVNEIIKTFK